MRSIVATCILSLPLVAIAAPQMPSFGKGKTTGKDGNSLGALMGMMGSGTAAQPGSGSGTIDIAATICATHNGTNPLGKMVEDMFGSPNGPGPDEKCMKDDSGGSGPYKANYTEDATLPDHTIYVPKTPPPANIKLPVIVWGNGACMAVGTMFYNLLNEIASHGFMIIANGKPMGGGASGMTTYKDLLKSIDWVTTNPAAKKYGNIDTSRIVAAGQSCGGLEALDATTADPRIKMTILFNSGYIFGSNAAKMAKFKNPIIYLLGGPKDIAQVNGDKDYSLLPSGTPALKMTYDSGHMGTYYQKSGGKFGKTAVKLLKWQFKGEASNMASFCDTKTSALVKAGWKIESKGGMCK